jgi:glycerophosphoryl diester phosphodiesterase
VRLVCLLVALSGCVSSALQSDQTTDVLLIGATDGGPGQPEPDRGPFDGSAADVGRLPDEALGGPPFVAGPAPETFDCTGAPAVDVRRSPVPLDCVFDRQCDERMVVGHRATGGTAGTIAPENSLEGIRAALVMGLDGVEVDVRHTVDDGLVLMRDDTVDRTTFGRGRVETLTLDALTALTLRPPADPGVSGDFSCARVPSLKSVFELTSGRMTVHLDVRTARVDLVVAAIREADLFDEVLFRTKTVAAVQRARDLDPAIRVQFAIDDQAGYLEAQLQLARPPEVIEIEEGQLDELAALITGNGQRVYVNAFGNDAVALIRGGETYLDLYERGAHVLQTEFPPLVLEALER